MTRNLHVTVGVGGRNSSRGCPSVGLPRPLHFPTSGGSATAPLGCGGAELGSKKLRLGVAIHCHLEFLMSEFFDSFLVQTGADQHDSLAEARAEALARRPWEDDDILGCVRVGVLPHAELLLSDQWPTHDEDEKQRQQRSLVFLTDAADGALDLTIEKVTDEERWSPKARQQPQRTKQELRAATEDVMAAVASAEAAEAAEVDELLQGMRAQLQQREGAQSSQALEPAPAPAATPIDPPAPAPVKSPTAYAVSDEAGREEQKEERVEAMMAAPDILAGEHAEADAERYHNLDDDDRSFEREEVCEMPSVYICICMCVCVCVCV